MQVRVVEGHRAADQQLVALLPPGLVEPATKVLPIAGNYKIYSDIYPHDGAPQVLELPLDRLGRLPQVGLECARPAGRVVEGRLVGEGLGD